MAEEQCGNEHMREINFMTGYEPLLNTLEDVTASPDHQETATIISYYKNTSVIDDKH